MTLRYSLILVSFLVSFAGQSQAIRTIDGSNNNVAQPNWGSHGDALLFLAPPAFTDGSSMSDYDRMNPRQISNMMFDQPELIADEQSLSDYVWVFGQFIDHDIILVENNHTEPLFIEIPSDDPVFPASARPISMFRSEAMLGTGTSVDNPRTYSNSVTAFVDGSAVYGSDIARANWLRTFEGGKLKTSSGDLLPWNTIDGEFNSPRDIDAPFMEDAVRLSAKHFVAGDVRANENPLLAGIHTIFVREHNRMCDEIKAEDPALTDEEIYQKARRWVAAFIQNVTYSEWLPQMGVHLAEYRGYRDDVNAQISNEFSAAAFRMGHTLINSNILRLDNGGDDVPGGTIGLRDAFFNPLAISLVGGIEPYLRGMAAQVQQKLDCKVVSDVRNFLFGAPAAGGMDLAAININRGRERGLPNYNSLRVSLGLPELKEMDEVTGDGDAVDNLLEIYGSVDNIDPWVGMLAEDYMPGAMFGSTIMTILDDQFKRLRDGDRFYFEGDRAFTASDVARIKSTTMRDLIMRNSNIKIMQANVFEAMPAQEIPAGPTLANIPLSAVAYPNPTSALTSIRVKADQDFPVTLEIYDVTGQRVGTVEAELSEGDNDIPLDLTQYTTGNLFNIMIRKNQLEYSVVRVTRF